MILAQPAGEAGPRVGRWGDFAWLEFQGVKTFKTNEVVSALLQAPGYLLASHPAAPLREFLPAVQQSLGAGYRAAGFREVAVKVSLDDTRERVVVAVTEGRRFRAGEVRVENPGRIPVADLVKRLTETPAAAAPAGPGTNLLLTPFFPAQKKAVWTVGESVGFDAASARGRDAAQSAPARATHRRSRGRESG